MSKPTPKAHILGITPYAQGKSKTGSGAEPKRLIKLSSNENPLGPSPQAIAAFRTMPDLHRYPDGSGAGIRNAIGEVFGLDAARIVIGAGSDELINLLIHAYAGEGDEVLYSEHGFLMYSIYAKAHGATPVTAPEKNLVADVDALLAAVTPRTKLLFLANPNNPTGTLLAQSEVERLRRELPPQVLLVLDAAYAEYVEAADYDAGAKMVDASAGNVVMLRTFSKIYGLPSLRIGWGYAPAEIVDVLNRIRSPFNVNSAAMAAAIAAVKDVNYTAYAVEYNARERARLTAELEKMGLNVTPSATNFVLVHFADSSTAAAANQFLLAEGIIAREVGNYGLPHCLRFTVGTEDENNAVIEVLNGFAA